MKIFDRIKLLFARNIDDYFQTSRRVFVPVVKGGMWVDHESAMSLSAVFGAVRYVSETIASLPWELRKKRPKGGSEQALTHPVYRLLHTRPNPELSAFNFKMLMLAWVNLWGNAYAEIVWDVMRRPVALWPIHPSRVTPKRIEGELFYQVTQSHGAPIHILPENMYHIMGLGDDGLQGYSVVSMAARSIGAGLASDEFAASFYQHGAVTSGVLKHPKALGDKAYDRLKESFKKEHSGPKNAWKPLILEEGMEWETMTMPLKDAQFLESRKFTVTEIARWFRVPPHKIADLDRATFANIEHQSIEVVQDTIVPWAVRMEQEADYKLISARQHGTFFSKVNVNGLLRGDSASRGAFYQLMRNMGALNADEIRDLEDFNPIPGGEKYVMQGQYTTLDKIGKEPEPVPAPLQIEPTEDPDDEEQRAAWRPIFYDTLERVFTRAARRKEDAKKSMTDERYAEWLAKSRTENAAYAEQAMRPAFIGFGASIGADCAAVEAKLRRVQWPEQTTEADIWAFVDDLQNQIAERKEPCPV